MIEPKRLLGLRRPWAAGLLCVISSVLLASLPVRRLEAAPAAVHKAVLKSKRSKTAPAGRLDPQSCGRSGCHPDVTAQWSASAHRLSGPDDPWYQAALARVAKEGGATAAHGCGECHTPAATAGSPAGHAGISCATCHSAEPHRTASATDRVARGAASCAGCHRARMEESAGGHHGSLLVLDDTHAWRSDNDAVQAAVRYPWQPQSCLKCHMPLEHSTDAGGHGQQVRSHRFAAANTALPALRGDREQLLAVTNSLKSSLSVDLVAMTQGSLAGAPPAVLASGESTEEVFTPLDRLPATVRRGESTRLDVAIGCRDIGHRFPGGKSDLGDVWLELKAVDEGGRVLFWSGQADEGSAVDPGAHFLRTVFTDERGQRVDQHQVWAARAVAFRQLIEPGATQLVRFRMDVPPDAGRRITVTARLRHRKFSWDENRAAFASRGAEPPRLPITDLAAASGNLEVVDSGAPLPDMTHPTLLRGDVDRLRNYAAALALGGDFITSRKVSEKILKLQPDDVDARINLSLSVQSLDEALALLRGISGKNQARGHFYLGLAEREATHYDVALAELRAASALAPGDVAIQREIAATLLLRGDHRAAIEALRQLLALDPEESGAYLSLRQAYQALGERENAERQLKAYNRLRADPATADWRRLYFEKHPEDRRENGAIHEHRSAPLPLPEGAKKPGGMER